ncbi:hypothetical protein C8Q74DRAFT_1366231 [Fomes fomentarius]|nr:hypothetical protein C8Q74DRAFT_1366231 [Fomes fomentarius]
MTLINAQRAGNNARKKGWTPMRAWVTDIDLVSHTRLVRGVDRPRGSKTSITQAQLSLLLNKRAPAKEQPDQGQRCANGQELEYSSMDAQRLENNDSKMGYKAKRPPYYKKLASLKTSDFRTTY